MGEFIARNGNVVVAMKKFALESFDAIGRAEIKKI